MATASKAHLGSGPMDVRKECIAVILNRPCYRPGELVEGVCCVNLQSSFESRGLFIK